MKACRKPSALGLGVLTGEGVWPLTFQNALPGCDLIPALQKALELETAAWRFQAANAGGSVHHELCFSIFY